MEKLENLLVAINSVIGLSQIQSILGIIILSFQAFIIILKAYEKIKEHIKKRDVKGIITTIEETTQQLEDIKEKIDESNKQ